MGKRVRPRVAGLGGRGVLWSVSAGAFPGGWEGEGWEGEGWEGVAAGDGAGLGDVAADGGWQGCADLGCEGFELG